MMWTTEVQLPRSTSPPSSPQASDSFSKLCSLMLEVLWFLLFPPVPPQVPQIKLPFQNRHHCWSDLARRGQWQPSWQDAKNCSWRCADHCSMWTKGMHFTSYTSPLPRQLILHGRVAKMEKFSGTWNSHVLLKDFWCRNVPEHLTTSHWNHQFELCRV